MTAIALKRRVSVCTLAVTLLLFVAPSRAIESSTFALNGTIFHPGDTWIATATGTPNEWFEWYEAYWDGSGYVTYWSDWYQFDGDGNFVFPWNAGGLGRYMDWIVLNGDPSNYVEYDIVPTEFDFAAHWSPMFYQATNNGSSAVSWMFDIPVSFDFDGDWVGNNNWENAGTLAANYGAAAFTARVYYTYVEDDTHVFLHYLVFHPRDWKLFPAHENDLEGVEVIIEKAPGVPYGQFVALSAFAHNAWYPTYTPEWVNDTHPAIYIEAKGHGMYPWNDDIFPDSCGGLGIGYSGTVETPADCDDRAVGMELVPFENTLWPQRLVYPNDTYANSEWWSTGAYFGGAFRGDDNCKAKFPWVWHGSGGEGFFLPDLVSPQIYFVNPYTSLLSNDPDAC